MSAAAKPKAVRTDVAAIEPVARTEAKNFVDNHLSEAFSTLADLLEAACMTDEPHDRSGDSDRLLWVAADLARRTAVNPPMQRDGCRESTESIAFDISALIKGARLVPGDTESSARTGYIEQAGAIIVLLAECNPAEAIDPQAPRPPSPNAKYSTLSPVAAPSAAGAVDDDARRDLAFECSFEISSLAGAAKKLFAEGEDRPVMNGLMGRIEQLCDCVHFLMKLHGDDEEDRAFDFDKVKAIYEGRAL